jgi:hypothetical protein
LRTPLAEPIEKESMMKKTWASAFGFIVLIFATVTCAASAPDTGQTKCYNNSVEIACHSSGKPFYGQYANYNINPISYTKLDANGNALPVSASSWVMVKDNVTGLIWENKTTDGSIHDKRNKYTWYDPADPVPGSPGNGTDTKDFIDALNSARFGSYSDWRMPTIKEISTIVSYNIPLHVQTINDTYFPNTQLSF